MPYPKIELHKDECEECARLHDLIEQAHDTLMCVTVARPGVSAGRRHRMYAASRRRKRRRISRYVEHVFTVHGAEVFGPYVIQE